MISVLVKIVVWSWKWAAVAKLLLRWRKSRGSVCVCAWVSALTDSESKGLSWSNDKSWGEKHQKCGGERVWWDHTQRLACCLSHDLPVMWLPWEPNIQPQLFPYKTKLLWWSKCFLSLFYYHKANRLDASASLLFFPFHLYHVWKSQYHTNSGRCHIPICFKGKIKCPQCKQIYLLSPCNTHYSHIFW